MSSPGMMPAMKRRPIETLARNQKRMDRCPGDDGPDERRRGRDAAGETPAVAPGDHLRDHHLAHHGRVGVGRAGQAAIRVLATTFTCARRHAVAGEGVGQVHEPRGDARVVHQGAAIR